ncbi:SDR family NAD(P)-dependent oxidoreductase [Sphingobium sp. BS19]|uniref:SDR family NAD(P)-dependent oxidoreductase n=1 Tax=Sphingobium sp. BS19 TaxID=3018973 RepID=UPI0022ED8C56|nr:SDR family NAD(P)-dependent oxidoreductase [Sphingobium sp. BS19]GLJ00274.1 short chain dehydrogenase [Sphingobium sp. BS19]
MSGRFSGKTALVTAAASGIGEATAEAFAKEGARLMLSDIDVAGGERVTERLRAAGTEAHFMRADGAQEQDVEQLVRRTTELFGALDVAANVVGGAVMDSSGGELHTKSVESWDGTLALSLRSTFLALKHEIAYMIEHGGGSIVNVASLVGMLYVPEGGPAYSAAKAGVIHLTRFAALAYAERGVRVNCIAPGVTITKGLENAVGAEAAKAMADRMIEGHAIKRTIKASEQAEAILWLASDATQMVTGQSIAVDGGWSAR